MTAFHGCCSCSSSFGGGDYPFRFHWTNRHLQKILGCLYSSTDPPRNPSSSERRQLRSYRHRLRRRRQPCACGGGWKLNHPSFPGHHRVPSCVSSSSTTTSSRTCCRRCRRCYHRHPWKKTKSCWQVCDLGVLPYRYDCDRYGRNLGKVKADNGISSFTEIQNYTYNRSSGRWQK